MPTTRMDARSPAPQHNQYLKTGSIIMLVSVVLGFAADYLFNLTLSRNLSPHEYGDYKVAYAFAITTTMLVLLGGDRIAPRILSTNLSQGDTRLVRPFLHFYVLVSVLLSVFTTGVTLIAAQLHLGPTDLQDHHPLVWMSLVLPLIAIGALLSRVLQAAKHLALSNLPWRIGLPLIKTALLLLLLIWVVELHLMHVIASGAVAVALIILWQWYKLQQLQLVSAQRPTSPLNKRELLKQSVPMMLAMLITVALNQIDLFMLEMLAAEQEVGLFAAASTTAHMIPIAQTSIAGLFLPLISPALAQGKPNARTLFWQGQKLISVSVLLLTATLIVFGTDLLSLFGDSFTSAQPTLKYLVAGYAIWALVAFSSTWLQYQNQGQMIVGIGCATLLIDTGLNAWLIPKFGIEGAAMATCITMACAAIATLSVFFWYQKKHN